MGHFPKIRKIIGDYTNIELLQTNSQIGCTYFLYNTISMLEKTYKNETLEYIASKLSDLKVNTDKLTRDHMDYAYTCFYHHYMKHSSCCPYDFYHIQKAHQQFLKDERTGFNSQYKIDVKMEEVFISHHGMRFAPQSIKDYVKNKDFIDCGAFNGDSALVLSEYTNKKIYSFEINPLHVKEMRKNMENNGIADKVVILNEAVGDRHQKFSFNGDVFDSGTSLYSQGSSQVDMTTIDSLVEQYHLKVVLIKADVEGFEYQVLKGAKRTLEKFRPIITVSVYHNYEGLFVIPDFIKKLGNYIFHFRADSINHLHLGEMIMFAYPAEIGYYDDIDEKC